MISLRRPSPESLRRFLAEQSTRELSYSAIGATSGTPPRGYAVDQIQVALGTGEPVFREAVAAIRRWDQFRLGWIEIWPPEVPITTGENVAVIGRAIGVYWINACRIVQVIDDAGPTARFGFSYGTLPDHVESGEERFLIEWDRATNMVCYEILAFSRPNGILAKLGNPIARRTQKRFGKDSARAMHEAIRSRPQP